MKPVHKRVWIQGKVQGVYFRASARNQARALGLTGLVRNEPDGSVYAEVEGPAQAVEAFLSWCRRGPEHARVAGILVEDAPPEGFRDFNIER